MPSKVYIRIVDVAMNTHHF